MILSDKQMKELKRRINKGTPIERIIGEFDPPKAQVYELLGWETQTVLLSNTPKTIDINGVEYPPEELWGKTFDLRRKGGESPRIHFGAWFNIYG